MNFYTVLTNSGINAIIKARASNEEVKLSTIAVGDGEIVPSQTMEGLQSEKHRLTSKEAVDKINRKVSIDLQEFRAKVQSIDYQGLFNTDYDLAIGLLTHRLSIQFLNTIKYHHIHLIALPQSL